MSSKPSAPPLVWIADDSPTELTVATRLLSPHYEVRTFQNGESLLEAASQGPLPDAVVLDWVMPGMTGIEMCRYLRASADTVHLPILLLTAQRSPEDAAEGLDAGANDFLAKPFHGVELLARIRSLLRTDSLRQRAEQAEAGTVRLLEGMPDALIVFGSDARVSYANASAREVLGLDLVGRKIQEAVAGIDTTRLGLAGLEPISFPDIRRRDRVYSPVARLMSLPTGLDTVLSLRDVTAERQVEARRLDFYSVIAHEVRSPLAALSMRMSVMQMGKGGPLSPENRAQLEKMQGQIKLLGEMINDFLEMARLDAGSFHLDREPVRIGPLLCEVAKEFEQLSDESGVRLGCKVEEALEDCVLADARRLRQVFFNLIANALKFTPRGGTVDAQLSVTDDTVHVAIRDSGVGIPPETAKRLFQRYARGEGDQKAVPGSGLGLMIVREIVEAHEGQVGLESEPGKGSVFWVRLPKMPVPHPA